MAPTGSPSIIVLDTDAGTDPDDAVALLLAQRHGAFDLRMVVTAAEEKNGERFRFLTRLSATLDAAGRRRPRLYAGLPRPNATRPHFCCDPMLSATGPGSRPPGPESSMDAFCRDLHALVGSHEPGTVVYVSIGGCTNLAAYLARHPDDAVRIRVVAMLADLGEGSADRRAEYNVRLDLEAAVKVLRWPGLDLTLVPVNTTVHECLAVRPGPGASPLWNTCRRARLVEFELMMRTNLRLFVQRMQSVAGGAAAEPGGALYGESFMHDPLALATVAGRFPTREVLVATSDSGQTSVVAPGSPAAASAKRLRALFPEDVDYPAFWTWLDELA